MKEDIEQLLLQSVSALQADGTLPEDIAPKIMVTRTKDPSHGDFACNIAMMLAKPAGMNPRELAGKIVGRELRVEDHEKMIRDSIAEMEGLEH